MQKILIVIITLLFVVIGGSSVLAETEPGTSATILDDCVEEDGYVEIYMNIGDTYTVYIQHEFWPMAEAPSTYYYHYGPEFITYPEKTRTVNYHEKAEVTIKANDLGWGDLVYLRNNITAYDRVRLTIRVHVVPKNTKINKPSNQLTVAYNDEIQSNGANITDTAMFDIVGETEGKEIGTYVATYTPKENYAWNDDYSLKDNQNRDSVTVTLRIEMAVPTKDDFEIILPEDPVYDGSPKEVKVTGLKEGMGDYISVHYLDSDGNKLTSAPSEPGDYTFYLSITQGKNYYGTPKLTDPSFKFTIERSDFSYMYSMIEDEADDGFDFIDLYNMLVDDYSDIINEIDD